MMVRAWLAAATMACGLLGATGAGATTFVVDVTAPPTIEGGLDRIIAFGGGSFPAVDLHLGDILDLTIDFGAPLNVTDYFANSSFVRFNVGRGAHADGNLISLDYAFQPNFASGSSSTEFTAEVIRNFGSPDPDAFIAVSGFSYVFQSIPEPQTWAAILLGLCAIGGALRVGRRRYGQTTFPQG